eukprot:SAG11_NODE_389_length_9870_cov_7.646812_6_plen_120_part_00
MHQKRLYMARLLALAGGLACLNAADPPPAAPGLPVMPPYGSLRGWCARAQVPVDVRPHLASPPAAPAEPSLRRPQGVRLQRLVPRLPRRPQRHLHRLRGRGADGAPLPERHTELLSWRQ